jgi:hypothetical protein
MRLFFMTRGTTCTTSNSADTSYGRRRRHRQAGRRRSTGYTRRKHVLRCGRDRRRTRSGRRGVQIQIERRRRWPRLFRQWSKSPRRSDGDRGRAHRSTGCARRAQRVPHPSRAATTCIRCVQRVGATRACPRPHLATSFPPTNIRSRRTRHTNDRAAGAQAAQRAAPIHRCSRA